MGNSTVRVLALQADHAGCGDARIVVPYTELRRLGHYVNIDDHLREDDVREYDVVVLQRPGNKWSLPIASWCETHRVPLVIELDDLCWALPDWNPFQDAWNSIDEETGKPSWEIQQETLMNASAATVTRESLAKEIRKFCPSVYVLPNFIDVSLFPVPNHDRSPVTIGYFGSHTHQRDIDSISGVIGKVMKYHPETFLLTIGGYPPTDAALSHGVPPERFRSMPWIPDRLQLNTALSLIDIGLAPLVQDPFNESKSWIKILEYGAIGAPTIASDIGPYHDFLTKDAGYLCSTKADWREALHDLLGHPQRRLEMGKRAREIAEEQSIQNNVWRYEAALQDVVNRFQEQHGSQVCRPMSEMIPKES